MPASASTRSARPAGAFTSPSFFRSASDTLMVLSSQQHQSAMHIRFHCSDGLAEDLGGLGVRKVLDETEHDRFAIAVRQAGQRGRHAVKLETIQRARFRSWSRVLLAAVQLQVARAGVAESVAGHI